MFWVVLPNTILTSDLLLLTCYAGIYYQILTGNYSDKNTSVVNHRDEVLSFGTFHQIVKIGVDVNGKNIPSYGKVAEVVFGHGTRVEVAVVDIS